MSLHVGVTTKALAWVSILFSGFCALAAWRAGQGIVSPLFLFFVLLGVILLVITGPIKMDKDTITCLTPIGHYQLHWDEIERIESDHAQQAIVFYAGDKRLAILGPVYWQGKDKQKMEELFKQEVARRHIPVRYTARVLYAISRNTRIN